MADLLAAELERIGRAAGLDAFGIAGADPFDDTRRALEDRKERGLSGGMQFTYRDPERSTDPARALSGAKALIVGARSYRRRDDDDHDRATSTGVVARYSWIDHYEPLRRALGHVADELRAQGWKAVVLADDNALVDRAAAHRAGLGFFGKNTNLLLHDGRGSEFVLGAIVTDAPLAVHAPQAAGQTDDTACGPCNRCLPACPTGALVAPGVLDARRCLAWLLQADGPFPREHRRALGGRIYGCDECQDACPPNRLQVRRTPPPPAEPHAEPIVDLLDLLETAAGDDATLLARHGRWYIARRDATFLRRNALVALGNVGDLADERTRAVIARYRADPDPLLREHAAWARDELGARATAGR
ncbi:MAG TPA: tRNA epoxyqueuosine(34) reductase QueG [Acidimicrobiales bacterium]|nr:tRNA epoxyqueuosine(34) reductase QueG [Acidimicrobiales bacterium]